MPPRRKDSGESRVQVWDLPTRLFHWLIVALFAFSWWTSEHDHFDWHAWSGYAILTLLLFRIAWGFVGSTTARFSNFLRGPRAVLAYARHLFDRSSPATPGHNPMGGWSVMALLLLLLTQIVLGLFAVDVDGVDSGPLNYLVSFDTGRAAAHLHSLVFNLLLVFTGLHVAFIAFYLVYKRENLVSAMLVGAKLIPQAAAQSLKFFSIWRALLCLAIALVVVKVIISVHF
jgi:cytochrome b